MPIRQLAPDVAAKIAAGEVVERPASVVKELIENSIDAGATQIRVDLINGGLQLIRITDNGNGIAVAELPLALARHATSKVAQIDDLEHIRSLGFRGEALASIAAVAEVTLLSRQRGAEQGAQIKAQNGQISDVEAAASPEGTTITVRNLFSSVPARLKFLKSRNTEVSHCHHLLEQYALAYPEIRFSVFSENRQIFATPGDGKLASVLVEVYGLQVAEQMVPMSGPEQSEDAEYPVVSGYVSRPACYKSTRQYISFFVNRRWVLSRVLTTAVENAYHSLLLSGRHPIAVVNIELDPTLLDVNVHPAKTEIRFLKERRVFAAILRAVRAALLEDPAIPQWKPKQEQYARLNTADQVNASMPEAAEEVLDADIFASEDAEESQSSASSTETTRQVISLDSPWITVSEEETGSKPPLASRLWQSHRHQPAERAQTKSESATALSPQAVESSRSEQPFEIPFSEPDTQPIATPTTTIPAKPPVEVVHTDAVTLPETAITASTRTRLSIDTGLNQQKIELPATDNEALPGQAVDPQQHRHLPRLRVVGQLSQSYIVTEGDDGMYLIDQHAAHERILLERMVAAMKARAPLSQLLLTPLRLELAPHELESLEEHQVQLQQIGFVLEGTDEGALEVKAVPSVLVKQMNVRSLHDLLLDLTAAETLGQTETWEERALANVACKAAIKANYFLTVSEMREMLEQLEQTQAPYSCCHGRPTMVHFGLSALAHQFERR